MTCMMTNCIFTIEIFCVQVLVRQRTGGVGWLAASGLVTARRRLGVLYRLGILHGWFKGAEVRLSCLVKFGWGYAVDGIAILLDLGILAYAGIAIDPHNRAIQFSCTLPLQYHLSHNVLAKNESLNF